MLNKLLLTLHLGDVSCNKKQNKCSLNYLFLYFYSTFLQTLFFLLINLSLTRIIVKYI